MVDEGLRLKYYSTTMLNLHVMTDRVGTDRFCKAISKLQSYSA